MMGKEENRQYLKRTWQDSYRCPSCDVSLKSDEVKSHFEMEVNLLIKPKKFELQNALISNDDNEAKSELNPCPWGIFQKVQRNRQSRFETKSRKRTPTDTKCPICSIQITRDINGHIEKCLKSNKERIDAIDSNNEDNTYNNSDEFEEYEWAGQKRIRVSSLLQGGYASIGVGTKISNKENEDDEDLNVDEDDTKMYGPPQYNECDVIAPDSFKKEHNKECYNYIRLLITENFDSKSTSELQEEMEKTRAESKYIAMHEQEKTDNVKPFNSKSAQQIIDSLKSKLRQLESHAQNKFKCLICLDEYHNPAISVSCWHVHCEECWLRSLGARKLCPQCNLITSPSDLRRIYM